MGTKHTPGPWVVVSASAGLSVGAQHVPDCFPKTRLCDIVTGTQADARLIAAAPELLGTLQAMVNVFSAEKKRDPRICIAAIQQARTAIAKATGND